MNKKVKLYFSGFLSLLILMLVEIYYLDSYYTISSENLKVKKSFVSLVGLPDLAISQDSFIRHRTLSSTFEIYSIDAALREYANATYVISDSKIRAVK